MADLIFSWGLFGSYGTDMGAVQSVDAGGVEVEVGFTPLDASAQAFTFNAFGYVADGEPFSPNSFLKVFGEGGDAGTVTDTSATVINFSSADPLYGDEVQNVTFRVEDVDAGTGGDLAESAGETWEDYLTIVAYDADGNEVPVTFTPGADVGLTGNTLDGNVTTDWEAANSSTLISIDGPVARIEFQYANGGTGEQGALISDLHFSTVDADVNEAPDAVDDMADVPMDSVATIAVLANDSDPDGDPISVTEATSTGGGTVTVNPDGTLDYTPPVGFTGTDTINYTITDPDGLTDSAVVTINVFNPNNDPEANDDTATTPEGETVTIPVLDNDTDPDGDPLTVTDADSPNGTVTINPDGTIDYTPDTGFTGEDTITYTVDDGNGGTDTAQVVVTVTDGNGDPVAFDDAATTPEDETVTIPVLDNDTDPDGDPLTVTDVSDPVNGTATINPDGTIDYTPDTGFTGEDTITYTVDDGNGGTDIGRVIVTVTAGENEPPVATDDTDTTYPMTPIVVDVLGNDTDPDGDPLTVTAVTTPANGTASILPDGTILYTPNTGFLGDDTFEYTVSDGNGGTDTASVTVTVSETGGGDEGRIDTDIFPVDPSLQALDPFDGLDEDPDPLDDLDDVTGTGGADVIDTGDDADTIVGGDGDDTILPGIDDDLVQGNLGDDYIVDVQGADTIDGGGGNDTIIAGFDTFSNYAGDDPFFPVLGFDSDPNTDDGRDSVQGGQGDDLIMTGDDDDTIDGGQGNDTVDAGIDDDFITGNQGDDSLLGGHGSDTIDGGQDNDYIDGSAPIALEIVDGFDPVPENDRDSLIGGLGDDTIIGGDDDDTLLGGSGNDILDGGIDEDSLVGGGGDDTLIGGDGADTMSGGDNRDFFDGASVGDQIDGGGGPAGVRDSDGEPEDYDTLDLSNSVPTGGSLSVTYTSADREDGFVEFFGDDGALLGQADFVEIENIIMPCFTPGTVIATPIGERLVEELREGDRIITRDNGIQEIRWYGRKKLTGHELARNPHLRPILVQAGSLGENLPEHDMLVSPNHRILVNNEKSALYFEEREVLVAAKHLTGLEGVDEVGTLGVEYVHFMFDQHEVVLSNGAWTESFQPGHYTLDGIGNSQRSEILELFPELKTQEGIEAYAAARRSLKKHEAKLLIK
ncbi:Ig-like domain-containing protein [Mesobacterium pallidum]|uniref:Ig-like domain-containing protein n=1 Tax=Mesobacterium pallidum TaxID=2872037 RepID=UPI001EE1582D|nr:Ig-like domain-containing protein [Mesobacterium pallidum]